MIQRKLLIASIALLFLSMSPAEAASAYKKCVEKAQRKHNQIAAILPLEGISDGLTLQQRSSDAFLNSTQVEALNVAYRDIQKCRQKVLKKAGKYPDILSVLNQTFSIYDEIYLRLQDHSYNAGVASVILVDIRNSADVEVRRLEANIIEKNAKRTQQNSENGWKLMQQGLDMLYPPTTPPTPSPSYRCRDYGGYTRCTQLE